MTNIYHGIPPHWSDGATAISLRDAYERAEMLRDVPEANELAIAAIDQGDFVLARAIYETLFDRGWVMDHRIERVLVAHADLERHKAKLR